LIDKEEVTWWVQLSISHPLLWKWPSINSFPCPASLVWVILWSVCVIPIQRRVFILHFPEKFTQHRPNRPKGEPGGSIHGGVGGTSSMWYGLACLLHECRLLCEYL
jgi:hypothetical protein